MANSKYEYVKAFEREETLLANTYIVVRIDGRGFHKLSKHYQFIKPNDKRALDLMNAAVVKTMSIIYDICFAYGISDEYSFVFDRDTPLFERRRDKLVSTVVSTFTAAYIALWPDHFTSTPLNISHLPTFDARAVTYPTYSNIRDYLSWRQVDCHINNLYNTTFWNLVQGHPIDKSVDSDDRDTCLSNVLEAADKGHTKQVPIDATGSGRANSGAPLKNPLLGRNTSKRPIVEPMSNTEAESLLSGTLSSDKNEILFSRFGINYNDEPAIYRKGSSVYRELHSNTTSRSNPPNSNYQTLNSTTTNPSHPSISQTGAQNQSISKTRAEKQKKTKMKAEIVIRHVDIIKDDFWDDRPWILRGRAERE